MEIIKNCNFAVYKTNMKSKILLILIIILCINNLSAQEDCFYGHTYLCVGEKYYIYADVANIRVRPATTEEIIYKFPAGQEIVINAIHNGEETSIDGVRGQWLYVTTTDGTNREGWLWSNSLSSKQLRRGNVKFVFGINSFSDYKFKGTVKAIDNGKIVDRKNYELGMEGAMFNNAKIIDNVSLENVKHVVHLSIGGGACMFPLSDFYFAWLEEKKKLVELPVAMSVSDACGVSYTESLSVPSENSGGIYNLLVKVTQEGTPPEKGDPCDYSKWDWEYKTELFKWNGEKTVKINH